MARGRAHRACWWIAAQQGDCAGLEACRESGRSIDARSDWGRTALHIATANDRVECVRWLARAGADANLADWRDGNTPLHLACKNCSLDAVLALVQLGGADFTMVNYEGNTAYSIAKMLRSPAARQKAEILRFLQSIGAGNVAVGVPVLQGVAVPLEPPEVTLRRVNTPSALPPNYSIPLVEPEQIQILVWDEVKGEGIPLEKSPPGEAGQSARSDESDEELMSWRSENGLDVEAPSIEGTLSELLSAAMLPTSEGVDVSSASSAHEGPPISVRFHSTATNSTEAAKLDGLGAFERMAVFRKAAVAHKMAKRVVAPLWRGCEAKKGRQHWHGWCFGDPVLPPTVAPGKALIRCPDGAASGDKVLASLEGGVFEVEVPASCWGEYLQIRAGKRSPEIFQLAPMVHIDALGSALASIKSLAATMSPQALRACAVKLVTRGFETMDSLATLTIDDLDEFVSRSAYDVYGLVDSWKQIAELVVPVRSQMNFSCGMWRSRTLVMTFCAREAVLPGKWIPASLVPFTCLVFYIQHTCPSIPLW